MRESVTGADVKLSCPNSFANCGRSIFTAVRNGSNYCDFRKWSLFRAGNLKCAALDIVCMFFVGVFWVPYSSFFKKKKKYIFSRRHGNAGGPRLQELRRENRRLSHCKNLFTTPWKRKKKKTVYLTSGFKLPECLSGRISSCSSDADMQLAPVKLWAALNYSVGVE